MSGNSTQQIQTQSLPQFLLSLVLRPKKAFAQLDESGKPSWIWPVVAALFVIWLAAILTMPILQKEAAASFDASLEQMGNSLSGPQLEQARTFSTNPIFLIATQGITNTIAAPILWTSAAGVLYLLSLAVGGQARFPTILRLSLWASIAIVLGQITLLIGTLASGASRLPGLKYLVVGNTQIVPSPVMAAWGEILAKVTIFDLWYLVLIATGIIVCAKTTRWKGILVTAIFWLLSLIPPVLLAIANSVTASAFLGE